MLKRWVVQGNQFFMDFGDHEKKCINVNCSSSAKSLSRKLNNTLHHSDIKYCYQGKKRVLNPPARDEVENYLMENGYLCPDENYKKCNKTRQCIDNRYFYR